MQEKIYDIVKSLWPEAELSLDDVEISYPPGDFGDYSCNVAMKLAGKLKMNPLEVAEEIKNQISKIKNSEFEKIEVVKPGFLNFFMVPEAMKKVLIDIEKEKDSFGSSDLGKGKTAIVEFGQPNTHKAITVGHLKSAVSGLSVVKLFEALGYKVIKANYFGDVGMHVAKATWGMMKEGVPEDFDSWDSGKKMEFIDKAYVASAKAFKENKEAEAEIRQINKDVYAKADNDNYKWYQKIRKWSIEHQDEVFASLGIEYDRQYPESEVFQEAVEIVKKHQGEVFQESEGAVIYDGEKEGLTTWVFLTGEGNPTYSGKDLALAMKKFSEYDPDLSIVTTSVEQADYFKVIIHVLEKIDAAFKGRYKHIPFGWLLMGGKKTSSRMGKTVKCVQVLAEARQEAKKKIAIDKEYDEKTKKEIIEKVALSGLKFLILSHEFHKNINYDPHDFIKLNGFSGPFILYSYVRTQAVLRKVGSPESFADIELKNVLNSKEELGLLKQLNMFEDVVETAGTEIAPHLVCNYVYEVAQKFNLFYEKHSIQNAEGDDEKNARLALTKATGQVLKNGLGLLGIEVLEKM